MSGDRDQIIALLRAAAENSVSLTNDAHLLLLAGRWAAAHALATLAVEEAGKTWLCHEKLTGVPGINKSRLQRDHEGKAIAARQMLAYLAGTAESVVDLDEVYGDHHEHAADYAHHLRMLGLYVDLTDLGIEGGADSVDEQSARDSLLLALRVSEAAVAISHLVLPDLSLGANEDDGNRKPINPPKRNK